MANREVMVKLKADASGFKGEMDKAGKSAEDALKEIGDAGVKGGKKAGDGLLNGVKDGAKGAEKAAKDTADALKDVGDSGEAAGRSVGDVFKSIGQAAIQGGKSAGEGLLDGVKAGVSALASLPVAGAVLALGGAIAVGLMKAIQDGLQVEADRDLFSARTGLDEATSAKFGRAAGEAYSNAWGDSIEGNLDAGRIALQNGLIDADATEIEIEQVITSLTGLGELMGQDIPRLASAAGAMVKSGLADNLEDAFDTLTVGFQQGVDKGDDLLDTMEEYPSVLTKLGLSADEAMGLLNQGLDAGARNSDFVADALKEFQIRATDASEASAEGFKLIGLNAEEMTAKIAAGGPGAKEGLDQVLDGLRAMEDPVQRNAAGVALFGTKWEDLGDAMLALDVTTAVDSLGGVESAVGAADRALKTMSDNTASEMESASRNIETAMTGIKGALAAAFSDEISGAAEWVQRNRGPLMEFMLDVINGAFDMAGAFVEFGANALNAIAGLLDGLAQLPFLSKDLRDSLTGIADGMREGADTMETDWAGALDGMQGRLNEWAAPEIMKANVHDATMAMTEDMDAFQATIDAAGGTIEINGDTLTAQQALDLVVANINAEDGTVTINGDRYPADRALEILMGNVNSSTGNIVVGADTSAAESAIEYASRTRYMTMIVNYSDSGYTPTAGFGIVPVANGAVIDYFARGGMRENHVAQFAPAGSWRVWGEPETGGEAYIPLAESKRDRSLDIWAETGRRLGVGAQRATGAQPGGITPEQLRTAMSGMQIQLTGGNALADQMAARITMARRRF